MSEPLEDPAAGPLWTLPPVEILPVVAEPVYVAGCGADCPCQSRRRFGVTYVVFSSGETDTIEEIVPGTRYRRRAHRPRARLRVFIRPRFLEVA